MPTSDRRNGADDRPRVLLIASGGGHWTQLLRLRPAWRGCDVAYATTGAGYRRDIEQADDRDRPRFYVIPPANMHQKVRLARQLLAIVRLMLRERPDAVVTTGASAGYFALRAGRILGSRTVWVDSIANAAELSLAGRRVGPYADLWLTQWAELAGEPGNGERLAFRGAVI